MNIKINKISNNDIAVIGLAANLPSASNINEFWDNIKNGKDLISELPKNRKKDSDIMFNTSYSHLTKEAPVYTKGAFLNEIDLFDYSFFKLSPREASLMDPIQRLFLQTVWHVIEDAGYSGDKLIGSKTGIFMGYASNLIDTYLKNISDIDYSSLQIAIPGNIQAIIPSRISYILDLKGPTMVIDTACSSSLVAIHMACQSIISGDCEQAIVGGAKIYLLPIDAPDYKLGIESSDYKTKSFDDSSDGTGIGEGIIAVMLKPLKTALSDGDNIYAVIKGSAINQDGHSLGLTAPNVNAQAEVIESAWKNSRVDPLTISYIETHGTGTRLGDPIEIAGIQKAFERYTKRKQFCGVGSVKTNTGHLFEASGILGFLKAVLALKYHQIPPNLHFNCPNQYINFEESPVYVVDRLTKWEGEYPLRCGVNAFGFSGTNCHVVLEEAPDHIKKEWNSYDDIEDLLLISAKTESGLDTLLKEYLSIIANSEFDLKDICYTANTGREHFNFRIAILINKESINLLQNKFRDIQVEEIKKGKYYNMFFAHINSDVDSTKLQDAVNTVVNKYNSDVNSIKSLLRELGELFINGAEINWEYFYNKEKRNKVSLPLYPFQKQRCWLAKPIETENLFYSIEWITKDCDEYSNENPKTMIVLKDHNELSTKIVEELRKKGNDVIEIDFGERFYGVHKDKFVIDNSENSYRELFNQLAEREISTIIHLTTANGNIKTNNLSEQENKFERGVYSLFNLIKVVGKRRQELDIVIVSECVNEVNGKEKWIHPENASLFGLAKIINREVPQIKCRCIDIDDDTEVNCILNEIDASDFYQCIAYRGSKRFVERFTEVQEEKFDRDSIAIRDNGVYLITGGTGGIGLEIAQHLAKERPISLFLVNRSKFPERESWDCILKGNHEKIKEKIKRIKQIESNGTKVHLYSADVSEINDMTSIIEDINRSTGKINGIIHSAGLSGKGFIDSETLEDFKIIMSSKTKGTWILGQIIDIQSLDFFVMFSSVATIFGAPGQGDYAAANSYLDSFANLLRKNGQNAKAVNWVAWKETGMAVDNNINIDTFFKSISNECAVDAFDKVLNMDATNVLVGEINYGSEWMELFKRFPIELSNDISSKIEAGKVTVKRPTQKHSSENVKVKGKSSNEVSSTEMTIAKIWGEMLGYNEIGINDNFYELGGDSLIAIKIVHRLNNELNMDIKLVEAISYLTIEELACYLEQKMEEDIPLIKEDNDSGHENNSMTKDVAESVNAERITSAYENEMLQFNVIKDEENLFESCLQKKGMSKKLSVKLQNEINTYLHWAYPLCVILSDEKYYPWFYENFINIFAHVEEDGKLFVDFLEKWCNYEDFMFEINLGYKFLESEKDILHYIKSKIDSGFYIGLFLDEYYLSPMQSYNKVHFIHNNFIYGYDDDQLLLIGFDSNKVFSFLRITNSEFVKAFDSGRLKHKELAPWASLFSMQLLYFKDRNYECQFNKEAFLNNLRNYICSKGNPVVEFSRKLNSQTRFGSSVWNAVIEHITNLLNGKVTLDYRAIHLLFEHKRGLYKRFNYLLETGTQLTSELAQFKEIIKRLNDIRLSFLKMEYTKFNKKEVQRIISEMEEIKAREDKLLRSIYYGLGGSNLDE